MSEALTRHLAAVMFTDMAGYTALMQRDESAALQARKRHRAALETHVPAHAGRLLQYFGDGSLCIFPSSVGAVEAAIAVQRELAGDPPLRIGLHTGDIAYDEQGAYGDAINITARLEAICDPGGVIVSDTVYADIRRHPRLPVVPAGRVRLKHVDEAVPTYALAVDGIVAPPKLSPGAGSDTPHEPDTSGSLPTAVRDRLDALARRSVHPVQSPGPLPSRTALIGRDAEAERLRGLVDAAEAGRGATVFLRGPRGVGKSRLGQEVAEHARHRGWAVLSGRAYPSERLVPYGPFSDALMPLLGGLSLPTLAQLTPGDDAALCAIFPALGPAPLRSDEGHGLPGESQTRLYWQFASMLARIASDRPLLLRLADLDFADRSSLELLYFVSRQIRHEPVLVVAEYAGADEGHRRSILEIEQAVVTDDAGAVIELDPLDATDTEALVRETLGAEAGDVGGLGEAVYTWSRGNPFLLRGTLRGLIDGGALRRGDGGWEVGDLSAIELPHSVRDAVLVWMGHLDDESVGLARSMAILDRAVSYDLLSHIVDLDDAALSRALGELVRHQVLEESEDGWSLMYSFRHPLIRETLRAELALPERRRLHASVGEALEAHYGDAAVEHADELAYHFGQAGTRETGARTIRYLHLAGEGALARHANREAVEYLQEALDRLEAAPPDVVIAELESLVPRHRVVASLARARRRIGSFSKSVALWRRLLALAEGSGEVGRVAQIQREIGLTYMSEGALEEAIEAFAQAADLAEAAGLVPLVVRSRLAQSLCYQAIGRTGPATRVAEDGLALATELGDPAVLGRVHSALLRLNIWTGRVDAVREHAEKALSLARTSGDRGVEFWSHWAMGAMEGLIGNTAAMARRIEAARRLADDIGSPFAHLEVTELAVEHAYATGGWSDAIDYGTQAIELARATDQRMVLPRLLVWVSLIHLGRGDYEAADALTKEAWEVSGAADADRPQGFVDLHSVVPAHIGRSAYHLVMGDWDEAIRIAERGLAIADRSGYVVWAIHHILPTIGEACIHARYLERAKEVGRRMREEAERVGHPLGLAWADACDALLTWLEGDAATGAVSMRKGAEALESIPLTYEGARLRRHLAGRLEELGEHEAAMAELLRAREAFVRLGARPEIGWTDEHIARLPVDPPRSPRVPR